MCFSGLVLPPHLLLIMCTPLQSMVLGFLLESSPMTMPGRLAPSQHIPLSWVSTASECSIGESSTTALLLFSGKCMYGSAAKPCLDLCNPIDYSPSGSSVHGNFLGKNIGVECHFLLQGIFPIQGSNPHLWFGRQILYLGSQGSHLGIPNYFQ